MRYIKKTLPFHPEKGANHESDEYYQYRNNDCLVPASRSAAQFIKCPKEMMVEGELQPIKR